MSGSLKVDKVKQQLTERLLRCRDGQDVVVTREECMMIVGVLESVRELMVYCEMYEKDGRKAN